VPNTMGSTTNTASTCGASAAGSSRFDNGFAPTRDDDQRKYLYRLKRESAEDTCPSAEYVSQFEAMDLEREAFAKAKPYARRRRSEFQVDKAFDGASIAPDVVTHAPCSQVEQATLLNAAALDYERKGNTRRAGSFRAKANRQAWCDIIGRRLDCSSSSCGKKYFKPFNCRLRYCPRCGRQAFRQLFAKHMGRLAIVAEDLLRHNSGDCRTRVIAQIDITLRNTGRMPSPHQVRSFNKKIRRLFRQIEKRLGISRSNYGFGWMDEFGSGNSNLHAHGVYVGPYLPQRDLSQWWKEITGDSYIISIKAAPSFEKALSHALKYPSKFWDAPPSRLVELEKAFHKVRRFHALARFYNPLETRNEPGMNTDAKDEAKRCPCCGSYLRKSRLRPGWAWLSGMASEGRIALETARIESNRAKVLAASNGSP
jgi:hypothetical protein